MNRRGIFANWQVKLICFLLAVATIYIISFSVQQKRRISLPLTVILPEDGYKAVSIIPDEVTLVVQGTEDRIYMLNAQRFKVSADFSGANREGVMSVPVEIGYDAPPDAIDFSEVTLYTEPASVRIYFEKIK